ncbi:Protein TIC [Vigna angularis]|uniref:Protein TIC n=1 Tax=Phaseolus angularis TaxID=3914 RepID=A0A8T0KIB4_PHAAN|nr:Protein TIC [Vigna angularis]
MCMKLFSGQNRVAVVHVEVAAGVAFVMCALGTRPNSLFSAAGDREELGRVVCQFSCIKKMVEAEACGVQFLNILRKDEDDVVEADAGIPLPSYHIERLISIATYTLLFFNSLQYGRYLQAQYPKLTVIFDPIVLFLAFYKSISTLPSSPSSPSTSASCETLPSPATSGSSHASRHPRRSLRFPHLITRIFSPSRGPLMIWSSNAIFVFNILCFLYGVASCVLGHTPYPHLYGSDGRVYSCLAELGVGLTHQLVAAPRRHCCDVLPFTAKDKMEIAIRECKDQELVYE